MGVQDGPDNAQAALQGARCCQEPGHPSIWFILSSGTNLHYVSLTSIERLNKDEREGVGLVILRIQQGFVKQIAFDRVQALALFMNPSKEGLHE